jgi:GTP cyclohydrolase II
MSGQLTCTTSARIPTPQGEFQLYHFLDLETQKEHLALVLGHVNNRDSVLVRVHSECFTGDVFGSLRCDCGEQLTEAMAAIGRAGHGAIIYLRQEGRGIGLAHKLRAYNLQDQGYDTVEANLLLGHQADEREYSAASEILAHLKIRSIRLLTNNPAKVEHLVQLGVNVAGRVPLEPTVHRHNAQYLATKVERMRHMLNLPDYINGHIHQPFLSTAINERLEYLSATMATCMEGYERPFITLAYAQSINGAIAGPAGEPVQISGPESMRLTHALRATHDAILVGVGTVQTDDPRLTVRLVEGKNPTPVILDTHLRLPRTSKLLSHPDGIIIAASDEAIANAPPFENPKVRLLRIRMSHSGKLDLEDLLRQLHNLGVRSVMVEGGRRVLTSFLQAGLVDYTVVTIAPTFHNGLAASIGNGKDDTVVQRPLFNVIYTPAGSDLTIWGAVNPAMVGLPTPHISQVEVGIVPSTVPTTQPGGGSIGGALSVLKGA